jgi:hypothetical protein
MDTPDPIQWSTVKRKISALVPHPKNPRQMTETQVAALTQSIERFNLAEIPVINTDDMLLAGHQRLRIMALLGRGDEEIDVRLPSRALTPAEADEYLLRSNKNTGEWDWDLLANNFDEPLLEDVGFDNIPWDNPDPDPAPDPGGSNYQEQYAVIVVCADEAEQERIYTKLEQDGYNCKVVAT